MKPVMLALLLVPALLSPRAEAGLGQILETTYLVLCKRYSPEGMKRFNAMPADQQAEVSSARYELLAFLGDFQNELHRFETSPLTNKELREKLSPAEREALGKHFVNTCGMTVLLEQPMTVGGCITDGGADFFRPMIAKRCAKLMNRGE